jgi:dihydrofolate reductase
LIRIAPIAAVAENGVIGSKNELPWRIKSEFAYFVSVTRHKPIIFGRKTFESLGGPLKDRTNIVVTRDAKYTYPGAIVTTTLEKAIEIARQVAGETGQDEIMIGGGAEIYKQALPLSDRLYLTEIHLKPEGDTTFPVFNRAEWQETKREFHAAKPGETADYTITVLDRKK